MNTATKEPQALEYGQGLGTYRYGLEYQVDVSRSRSASREPCHANPIRANEAYPSRATSRAFVYETGIRFG